jgi:hypothetical protein
VTRLISLLWRRQSWLFSCPQFYQSISLMWYRQTWCSKLNFFIDLYSVSSSITFMCLLIGDQSKPACREVPDEVVKFVYVRIEDRSVDRVPVNATLDAFVTLRVTRDRRSWRKKYIHFWLRKFRMGIFKFCFKKLHFKIISVNVYWANWTCFYLFTFPYQTYLNLAHVNTQKNFLAFKDNSQST